MNKYNTTTADCQAPTAKLGSNSYYKELHAKGYNFSTERKNALPYKFLCTGKVCSYALCQKSLRSQCEAYNWAISQFERLAILREPAYREIKFKEPGKYGDKSDFHEFQDALKSQTRYVGLGKEAENCGRWGMLKECEHGHKIVKRLLDGREWCPICGQDDSEYHNRRKSRLVERVFAMDIIGYFVFEVPMVLRGWFEDVGMLRQARRYLIRLLERELDVRGVSRWHYYGDPAIAEGSIESCVKYHPHLNILIEHGYLGKKQLRRIRRLWSKWLMRECNSSTYRIAPVYYQYGRSAIKKWHWLSYITRSTFKELTEGNRHIASELFGFNNCHGFGKFSDADKTKGRERFEAWLASLPGKEQSAVEVAQAKAHEAFESGLCPVCGGATKLVEGVVQVDNYEVEVDYGGGLYLVHCRGAPGVEAIPQARSDADALLERFNIAELRGELHRADVEIAVARTYGDVDSEAYWSFYLAICKEALSKGLAVARSKAPVYQGGHDVAEVKSRVNLLDVVSRYTKVKGFGERSYAKCLFHDDRAPSLCIYNNTQTWHCFGCGRGGDVVDLVMMIERVEFKEALSILAQ